ALGAAGAPCGASAWGTAPGLGGVRAPPGSSRAAGEGAPAAQPRPPLWPPGALGAGGAPAIGGIGGAAADGGLRAGAATDGFRATGGAGRTAARARHAGGADEGTLSGGPRAGRDRGVTFSSTLPGFLDAGSPSRALAGRAGAASASAGGQSAEPGDIDPVALLQAQVARVAQRRLNA
ncbi:unnamed protein product, partial [Prorocentrum cordatum]